MTPYGVGFSVTNINYVCEYERTMGSYRVILIGPPDPLDGLVQEVCSLVSEHDKVKNSIEYEELSVERATETYHYRSFHDEYPYLFHFPREKTLDYLSTLGRRGYEKISGHGIWFVAYHCSPGSIIEEERPSTVQYTIEDGDGTTITPFSYDPAQDFKKEM